MAINTMGLLYSFSLPVLSCPCSPDEKCLTCGRKITPLMATKSFFKMPVQGISQL